MKAKMTTLNQDNPAIFSGDRARNYDEFVQRWIPGYSHLIGQIPLVLTDQLQEDKGPILVVGCGTGNELISLTNAQPNWELWGIDPSPEMVALAHHKLSNYPRVQIREGTLEDLPLPLDPIYRGASLLLVLHFIPDDGSKLRLLRELAARLRPGAPLILADIFGSAEDFPIRLKTFADIVNPGGTDPAIIERLKVLPERIQYISENRLTELLQKSGFSTPTRIWQSAIYGAWVCRKMR